MALNSAIDFTELCRVAGAAIKAELDKEPRSEDTKGWQFFKPDAYTASREVKEEFEKVIQCTAELRAAGANCTDRYNRAACGSQGFTGRRTSPLPLALLEPTSSYYKLIRKSPVRSSLQTRRSFQEGSISRSSQVEVVGYPSFGNLARNHSIRVATQRSSHPENLLLLL